MKKQIQNCTIHGDTEHALYVSGKHQQWKCLKCQTAETFIKRSKLKLKALEYKGGKCEICGYDKNISALEFHHLDQRKKNLQYLLKVINILGKRINKNLINVFLYVQTAIENYITLNKQKIIYQN